MAAAATAAAATEVAATEVAASMAAAVDTVAAANLVPAPLHRPQPHPLQAAMVVSLVNLSSPFANQLQNERVFQSQ